MKEALETINRMQGDGIIGQYAIGGAIGAAFYLEPTTSLDIDIFISFQDLPGHSLAPLRGIYDYLKSLGAEPRDEHIFISGWLIQFLPAEDALSKEALSEAVQIEIRGVKTWVMKAEHLMAMALKLGRKKDEARVERFIEIGPYDARKLNDILARYNLIDKWKKMSEAYRRKSP